jgi:hypothetical protein
METAWQLWQQTGRKEYGEAMFLIAEKSKARLLLDEINTNLYYKRIQTGDTLLQKQWQTIQAVNYYEKASIEGDEKADSMKRELQYRLSLFQKEAKEKYPMIGGYGGEVSAGLLGHIPKDASVLEYFAGDSSLYVIEADQKGVAGLRKLADGAGVEDSIGRFVSAWFQQGPSKMINDPAGYYRSAYQVYHWLLGAAGPAGRQCIIVPDGIIGYVPFDALVSDSVYRGNIGQWPFVARQASVYYSYSLQTWQRLRETKRSNELFAGFFISFDSSHASIPAVRQEYEAIRKTVSGSFFREREASAEQFRATLDRVNVLHISTHAFLQGEKNMPALQLADDRFFLFELYGRSFQPQLVVLSACRTAHGMLAKGEGIISLARGFTASGGEGIVAGLWNMNDESTSGLMEGFYGHLRSDPLPAGALREAKLQWLAKENSEAVLKLPYFWAGLIYSGDNEPVRLQAKKSTARPLGWIVGIVSVLALAVLLVFQRKRRMTVKNGT